MIHPCKLGKRASTHDARDLLFADYRTLALPQHPARFGHENLVASGAWAMLGNGPDNTVKPGFQGAGDCVFAGACHETMLWNAERGVTVPFTGANAIADYSAVTGYVVGNDSTDQGTDVRTALKYRAKTGIVDAHGVRHKIAAYVALEPGNLDHLYEAAYLFSAVGIGIEFPSSAMDQFNAGKTWSVVKNSPVEGGHYIPVVAKRASIECVTWGSIQRMTTGFYEKYCDEAWVLLTEEDLGKDGHTLEGFDMAALKADLLALKK